MQDALARGDITAIVDDVSFLLSDYQISLDRKSPRLTANSPTLALQAYVRALQAIEKRNAGLPVETPKFSREALSAPALGGTLRDAFEGWNKERPRAPLVQFMSTIAL